MSVNEMIARVRIYASEHGLKPAALARLAGLHVNTLRRMNEPDWNPKATTLRKLDAVVKPARASDCESDERLAG